MKYDLYETHPDGSRKYKVLTKASESKVLAYLRHEKSKHVAVRVHHHCQGAITLQNRYMTYFIAEPEVWTEI
jgi:hypothetical protein